MKKVIRPRNPNALLRDTRGLSTVEYIILLVLVAIVGIGAWSAFGTKIKDKIMGSTNRVETELGDPTRPAPR